MPGNILISFVILFILSCSLSNTPDEIQVLQGALLFDGTGNLPAQFAVGLPSILIAIFGGLLIHTRVPKILAALVSGRL
ncbi:MAG: hypothetical protein ACFCU6_00505 [Balneolaceae bacterium]